MCKTPEDLDLQGIDTVAIDIETYDPNLKSKGLGGMFSKKGLSDFFFAGKDMALKNLTSGGALAGIAGLSALPFIFQGQEDEEENSR